MSTDDNAARGEPYLTNIERTVGRMDKKLDNVEEGVDDVSRKLDRWNGMSKSSLRWEIQKTQRLMIFLSGLLALEMILLSIFF